MELLRVQFFVMSIIAIAFASVKAEAPALAPTSDGRLCLSNVVFFLFHLDSCISGPGNCLCPNVGGSGPHFHPSLAFGNWGIPDSSVDYRPFCRQILSGCYVIVFHGLEMWKIRSMFLLASKPSSSVNLIRCSFTLYTKRETVNKERNVK
ncbi:hypothetical protein RJT34_29564 [Clitoria ternatea]|uniref:Cyclotide n=1 Tax=Clitoria ternatea TaxID=43366 RepID=A0AAN9FIW0_CLITE